MTRLRQNFQLGTITNNPLAIGGTTLNSADLAGLMAVTGSDYLAITLDPEAVHGAPEIIHVTAHTAAATSATITRAQEGTVARAHPLATVWEHNITEDDFDYANLANLPVTSSVTLKSITVIAAGTVLYTTPAGISLLWVEGIGAGGGGGGCTSAASNAAAGAGGGGGGWAGKLITSPAASYACVVGAGGTAGANTGAQGGEGADTTFGAVLNAQGGLGGNGMTASTAVKISQGSPGGGWGGGNAGDVSLIGGPGGHGTVLSGTIAMAGQGGNAARGGGGGYGRTSGFGGSGVGIDGYEWGGGGSGGLVLNGSGAVVGAAGANGRIWVWEYGT